MKIRYKGAIYFLILIILVGCSATTTSQPEEPASDAISPAEDNPNEAQPVDAEEATKESVEESMEEEMSPTPETSTGTSDQNPLIETAVTDLAQRLNISEDQIEVVSYEAKTWSDTSMGCPHPDMAYTQVPQDGALIQLSVNGQIYNYHSGGSRAPFVCEQPQKTVGAKPTPLNLEDFITPSGNIDN